ncbi:MAG: ubiquinol-cytochrome c reductase iron-sulfur subunit [Nitrospirae bacterium]|nr:ubiquinol-cytochrome c reductase iron-sulfur subunit [Nitrospirota bacterium]
MTKKDVKDDSKEITRRKFFLIFGWFGILSSLAGSAFGAVRFMFPNVLYEPSTTFKIGKPSDYPPNTVTFVQDNRLFVVRGKDGIEGIRIISSICTHMGCTPKWVEAKNQWECPCHGSVFNIKGNVIAGPAPDPLPWYKATIASDGRILVDSSKKNYVKPDYQIKV